MTSQRRLTVNRIVRVWHFALAMGCVVLMASSSSAGQPPAKKPPKDPTLPDSDLLDGTTNKAEMPKARRGNGEARAEQNAEESDGAESSHRADWNRVAELMQRAAHELATGQTAAPTQQLQVEALTVLTALAETDRQQSGQKKSPTGQSKSKQGKQPPKSAPRQASKQPPAADKGQVQSALEPDDAMSIAARVWGQLRADLQSRLRAAGRVEFLPGYEKETERYYRKLGTSGD